MPRSMTGFARCEESHGGFQIIWRLKSVNHRYLDLSFRLPEGCEALEIQAANHLKRQIARGHLDCILVLRPEGGEARELELNKALLNTITDLEEQTRRMGVGRHERAGLTLHNLLSWPGVVQRRAHFDGLDDGNSPLFQAILAVLQRTAQSLVTARSREGAELAALVHGFLDALRALLEEVAARLPEVRERSGERLRERLRELTDAPVEEGRLAQELALLLSRMDVTEEVDRLGIHLQEMAASLTREEPVGRRLDFLCQEMGREINTLCSKSQDGELSRAGVEMKVVLEKLREQIQNLE